MGVLLILSIGVGTRTIEEKCGGPPLSAEKLSDERGIHQTPFSARRRHRPSAGRCWYPIAAVWIVIQVIAGCTDTTAPRAVVYVDNPIHDFGEHRPGETLSHTFTLTNPTDMHVNIIRAVSSCSCVVAGKGGELPDISIPPQDTLPIPVQLHVGARQEVATGRVVVHYGLAEGESHQSQQSLALQVRARVIPDYRITPKEIDFGEVDGLLTERITRKLRLTPVAANSLAVEQVRTSSKFLTARVLPQNDDRSFSIEVSLDVSRLLESRSLHGSLTVATDSEQLPNVLVGFRAKYRAPAAVDPPMIVIGSDEEGNSTRELCVSSSCPSRILGVTIHDQAIHVEFDAQQRTSEHRLRLRVAPCHEEGLSDEIEIELELFPDGGGRIARVLSVPVHRFCQKKKGMLR